MQSGRRKPNEDVAGGDGPSIYDARPLDDADDEAGDVVLAVGVEPGHLRRLAADERAGVFTASAGDAGNDLLGDIGRKPAGREVVEEEQRLRPLHEDVVHAVVHQVGADRIVPAGHERHLELRAHTVGARHEHRLAVAVAVELEQTAERPDLREDARRERGARQRLDAADGLVPRVDVDARLSVVHY